MGPPRQAAPATPPPEGNAHRRLFPSSGGVRRRREVVDALGGTPQAGDVRGGARW